MAGRCEPPTASAAEPRGSGWRGVVFFVPAALYAFGLATLYTLLTWVAPGFVRRNVHHLTHAWGRGVLFLFGVRIDLHGGEHLHAAGPKLVLYNHVSLLDLFLLAALLPERPLVLYKAEFHRIPIIGLTMRRLGMIPVQRERRAQAIESLARSAARLVAERGTLLMAPEGTRSRLGGLQRFKLGAFHIAAEEHLPVVPMIFRGVPDVLPMGSFLVRSGTVRVDCLNPIETRGWSHERAQLHAEETRAVFLRYLEPAPGA